MSSEMKVNDQGEILRKFTRELPVVLNDGELQTYGKILAEKCKEQELALDKKKNVVADHNNRIKVITNEIKRIADARAKGEEMRPVMCGERLHGNVIEIVRLDSQTVVDTRPAGLQDLQQTLPGVPEMPDGFDPGPRGDGLGSLADKPADEPPGEMQTSSSGDEVFVGDGDNEADEEDIEIDPTVCGLCGTKMKNTDKLDTFEGATVHADCMPDDSATDLPKETEDEMIDRKLAERDAAADDGDFGGAVARKEATTAADSHAGAPKGKPTRERSAKKNGKRKR